MPEVSSVATRENPWRVLIVDDVTETRRSMRLMMTQVPHTLVVAIAQNGRQAIELTRREKPDIAFVDVNMPGIDGLEAIEQMLKVHPDMACIVVSAERDHATLQRAIDAGASSYLLKPVTIDQISAKVSQVEGKLTENRERRLAVQRARAEKNAYLRELADEYIKTRRTDAKAIEVFEQLAEDPACELRFLKTLAVLYIFRHQWPKLQQLADRLAQYMPTR